MAAPIRGTAPTYVNGVPTGLTAPYDNSLAAADYTVGGASYVGHSFFHERDSLYDIKGNTHLFPKLWNGGIDLAGGYEHREINQKQIPDPVQVTNDQLGFNQSPSLKFRQEVELLLLRARDSADYLIDERAFRAFPRFGHRLAA